MPVAVLQRHQRLERLDRRKGGSGGPAVEFSGPVYMEDRTQAELVGQRIDWAITRSSF